MPDLHGWITQQIDQVETAQREGRIVLDEHGRYHHTEFSTDPTVLRRCAADRRILARHRLNPNAYWADAAMCEGCGTEGEMGYAVTENLNDCPELLDLGYAHGLTPEILATLDQPEKPTRPTYPGKTGSVILDSIASLHASLADVPPALRGPNWKATP